MAKTYYNIIETLVSIYAVNDGSLQILLKKKKEEPYKDYWILPGGILSQEETIEEQVENIMIEATGLPSIYKDQGKIFSNLDRDPNERIVACNYFALTIKSLVNNDTHEIKWFDINKLPKMAYDHEKIVRENIERIKHQIIHNDNGILFKLFPSTFTLPELQRFFESISGRELDRRNFRKKVITNELVAETGEIEIKAKGRPGKLYRLNNKLEQRSILWTIKEDGALKTSLLSSPS